MSLGAVQGAGAHAIHDFFVVTVPRVAHSAKDVLVNGAGKVVQFAGRAWSHIQPVAARAVSTIAQLARVAFNALKEGASVAATHVREFVKLATTDKNFGLGILVGAVAIAIIAFTVWGITKIIAHRAANRPPAPPAAVVTSRPATPPVSSTSPAAPAELGALPVVPEAAA